MTRKTSNGTCEFCNQVFPKQAISRHLKTCEQRPAVSGKLTPLFHLLVEGRGATEYWLHVELPATAKLSDLDQFLRDIWVECCGHLSVFTIAGVSYYGDRESVREFGGKPMATAIERALGEGMKFNYEYDFGSTTELTLKVVEIYEAAAGSEKVRLLARNEPPQILCSVEGCGKLATDVCAECIWNDAGWVCEEHAEDHECGEDMLLPVVNSPRVGVCGYTG